jgi:short-subunit dehydrogenase
VPVAYESTYAASKFALSGFSKSLALELEPTGVHVSLITTGIVATGFAGERGPTYRRRWPRPLTPERVARTIVTAVERERAECTVPRWLVAARIVDSVAPPLYRMGSRRAQRRPPSTAGER